MKVILVAALAVVANEELPNTDPVIPPVTPKLPVIANEPDVVNDPLNTTISVVVSKDPVMVCVPLNVLDPVDANAVDGMLFSNCALDANDAVVANDPVRAKLAVVANEAVVGVNVILVAALAVVANEAVLGVKVMLVAADAVVANDELPNNDPVIPRVTPRLPLIANDPDVVKDPLNTTVSEFNKSEPLIVWSPVYTLDPVVANTADDVLFNNRAFCAKEAVVLNEAVLGVNVIDVAALAVVANELVLGIKVIEVAALEVVANDAVVGVNVILVAADAVVAKDDD